MNIIVTLAGQSRRFLQAGYTVPKAFIYIDGRPMISHVVEMFSSEDQFYFVMNTDQAKEFPAWVSFLESLVPRSRVVLVEPHEKGPVYSALQVKGIPDDEEVIISYCDFIVDWDYRRFLHRAHNHDAAISVFRGFHPASFGSTFYAYIRADGNKMLELREKKSFTSNRAEEPASAGIYYFNRWSIFKKYAEKVLNESLQDLSEYYVSLLYNPMILDGLDVIVDDVERFICWGTPEDLDQYLFWLSAFRNIEESALKNNASMEVSSSSKKKRINLIPMAGKGARFKKAGYRVVKPLIQVMGKPMVITSCLSFPVADQWIFLPRGTEAETKAISRALRQYFTDCTVIRLENETSGQAATCLLAEEQWEPDSELLIASCDYQVIFEQKKWAKLIEDLSIDGVIWTYRLKSSLCKDFFAFAYCRVSEDGFRVVEVVEKNTISNRPDLDPMVVGNFWFRRAGDFAKAAKSMIEKNIRINNEHYVGTCINQLLAEGAHFVIFDVDQWISFGDPFELKVFEYWEDHFRSRKF